MCRCWLGVPVCRHRGDRLSVIWKKIIKFKQSFTLMSASLISSTLAPTECRIHRPSQVHNKPELVKYIAFSNFFFLSWYNSSYKQRKKILSSRPFVPFTPRLWTNRWLKMSIIPTRGSWEKSLDNDAIWKGAKIFCPGGSTRLHNNFHKWTHFQSQGQ